MAQEKLTKTRRNSRQSAGERRSSKPVRLTNLQKVLLGHGFLDRPEHRPNRPRVMKRRTVGGEDL